MDPAIRRRFQIRIYIPLPDEIARRAMFEIHFGKEGHQLTAEDFDYLAKQTDGYSGSDISNMAKQALMIPVQKVQYAEYFYQANDGLFYPCDSNHPGAQRMAVQDVPRGKLFNPGFSRVCILNNDEIEYEIGL